MENQIKFVKALIAEGITPEKIDLKDRFDELYGQIMENFNLLPVSWRALYLEPGNIHRYQEEQDLK